MEQGDWIFDGGGQVAGCVRPTLPGGALGVLKGTVRPQHLSRGAAAAEIVFSTEHVDVIDRSGATIFRVSVTGHWITMTDASGTHLGDIAPMAPKLSEPDHVRFFAHDPDPPRSSSWKKTWERVQVGYVKTAVEHADPADGLEILDRGHTTVARVLRSAPYGPRREVRLTRVAAIDEPLNSLLSRTCRGWSDRTGRPFQLAAEGWTPPDFI